MLFIFDLNFFEYGTLNFIRMQELGIMWRLLKLPGVIKNI
jgi:hypothetical protein